MLPSKSVELLIPHPAKQSNANMGAIDISSAQDVVRRYFARRENGARVSVDDVMPQIDDASDRDKLRSQVIRLIAGHSRPLAGIGSSAAGGIALPQSPEFPVIDGYEIIDWIGRGGMGVVYEAYQSSTGRRVAIKVLRDSVLADEPSRRRFEREVDLAARLHHTNIVSVVDAGVHVGKNYCVMEYVDGNPLDQAVIENRLDTAATLRLVATIARTVDYAHQRGVLHRDLKPSNILVDAAGRPHLLDFGLAKAIMQGDAETDVDLSLSQPGGFIGTLGYAAPEQACGASAEVSVRSDVYSLGAVAYALLTRRLPITTRGTLETVLGEIRTADPPAPSRIVSRLDRDVDAMLLKALEKSPAQRYPTAAAFADDIDRYLRHEPIVARPIGPIGRLQRWVRRRPLLAALAGVVIVAVVVCGLFFGQLLREQAGRTAAESSRRAAVEFVQHHLQTFADPNQAARGDVLRGAGKAIALERIDATSSLMQSGSPSDPVVCAFVMKEVGRGYLQCARYDKATECLTAARSSFDTAGAAFRTEALDTEHDLALLELAQAKYSDAAQRLSALLPSIARLPNGDRSPLYAQVTNNLGWALKSQGNYADARARYQQALAIREQLNDQLGVAETLNDLGQLERSAGMFDAAISAFERALEIRRATRGEHHTATAATQTGLGSTLRQAERTAEAEPYLRAALETRLHVLGAEHPDTVVSMNELGLWLLDTNQFDEAERLLREALRLRRIVAGESHRDVAASLTNLGLVLSAKGSFDQARECFLDSLKLYDSRNEAGHADAIRAHLHLGNMERRAGNADAALDAARTARLLAEKLKGAIGKSLASAAQLLAGRAELSLGRVESAVTELSAALAETEATPNIQAWRVQLARLCLADAQMRSGDSTSAMTTLAPLRAPLSSRREIGEALSELQTHAHQSADVDAAQRVDELAGE